jgi:hypothetical protein
MKRPSVKVGQWAYPAVEVIWLIKRLTSDDKTIADKEGTRETRAPTSAAAACLSRHRRNVYDLVRSDGVQARQNFAKTLRRYRGKSGPAHTDFEL